MESPPRTDTMASVTYPRYCDSTNCNCPAPNGFGPDGNRVCLTFGPARWQLDDDDVTGDISPAPETIATSAYEMCDFCDAEVLETEMGTHVCRQAVDYLRDIARDFMSDEAGEHDSDSDSDEDPCVENGRNS